MLNVLVSFRKPRKSRGLEVAMLRSPGRKERALPATHRLYEAIVARARTPLFHEKFGVADTIDGRFDLLVVHLSLVVERLKQAGPGGADLAGVLITLAFAGFDDALRQLGVSDFGMSRRIKAMANAFYGRLEAYAAAGDDEPELALALLRNLYRGDNRRENEARQLARYVIGSRRHLNQPNSATALFDGTADFGPSPEWY
jgi:cytochrome b pre-mRNA-processing protein 3